MAFIIDKVNEINLKYFINHILVTPWNNHLFFGVLVFTNNNLDVMTIQSLIRKVNTRFRNLFDYYKLNKIVELDVEVSYVSIL